MSHAKGLYSIHPKYLSCGKITEQLYIMLVGAQERVTVSVRNIAVIILFVPNPD